MLLIPSIQRFAVQETVAFGSDYLHTELKLEALYLEPFKTLRLDGLLIRDQENDTLLYVDVLKVDIQSFDRSDQSLTFDYIEINKAYINLYKPASSDNLNLQFLIDVFSPTEQDTTSRSFGLFCNELVVSDLRFNYDDFHQVEMGGKQVDFAHLSISSFSGRLNDINISDSISAKIRGLHFDEKSGLKLRSLYSNASFSNKGIYCKDLSLVTNRSYVEGTYSMTYDSLKAFQSFFDDVTLNAEIDSSFIDFHDIGYFAEKVGGILTPMRYSGRAFGSLSSLNTEVDSLYFASSGALIGNVRLKGLPDLNALMINANLTSLSFSVLDFEQLYLPTAKGNQRLDLPQNLDRLGRISFDGKLMGFISDFVAFGTVQTQLGVLRTDINLKTGNQVSYSGKMASSGFEIGKLIDSKDLGSIGFDVSMRGNSFDLDDLFIKAKGNINHIQALEYRYQNISLDGHFQKGKLEGNFSINDPNGIIDFIGSVDFNNKVPSVSCVSRVTNLRWAEINLLPKDTFGVISARINLDMEGGTMETLNGVLSLRDVVYENETHRVRLDSLTLSDRLTTEGHDILLETEFATAHVSGNTSLTRLPRAILEIGNHFAPEYFELTEDGNSMQYFKYDLRVANNENLLSFIYDGLNLDNPLHIEGEVKTEDHYFEMSVDTISWKLGDVKARNQTILIKPENHKLKAEINSSQFSLANDYFLENLLVGLELFNDSLGAKVSWDNQTQKADSGGFELLAYTNDEFLVNAQLINLYARIAGVTWNSTKQAELYADSNRFIISDLDVRSENGHITCRGGLTGEADDHIYFDVERFDLQYLSNFGLLKNDFVGLFDGSVDVYKVDGELVANSDLIVDSLGIDDFSVGRIEGNTSYNANRESLELLLDLNYQGTKNIGLKGDIFPFRAEDQLDINIVFNDFRARVLEPFLTDFVENMDGNVNGELSLDGMLKTPTIYGSLRMTQFGALVKYLNTSYTIPDGTINIEPGFIGMDYVKVLDEKGSQGHLTATVYHDQFENVTYDLFFDVENFLALNTGLAQNEDYYGTANVTGDIGISGYEGQTNISVEASTNKGTKLSIPLEGRSEASDIDYIRFVPPKDVDSITLKKPSDETVDGDLRGLNLDFQLAVNDNAEVQIIFDEKIGDIIKVHGNGDMLLQIDNRGKFNMYGEYIMSGGDYLFTLQNIINKRFSVKPGSKIVWNGSPTDAIVDLTAVYSLRAAPINLTASIGDTSEIYQKRMPVNVMLNMEGALLEPKIGFDVSLPNLPESDIANQLLDPNTTSEQDMNQQVFALLLTNNFFGQGSGVNALGSATQNTTYEMVSNQFSNWISQYFNNVDVGVMVGNQTEVNVSTDILNDRLFLELNGSVQNDNARTQQANDLAGEFNIEYKINKDGSLRARVFNEANNYNPTNLNQSPYTQGLGVFYRREFDTFGGLIKSVFSRGSKKKKQ
ncbi:MAG: translocation/assembly module TamB domain-containing protein [Salibacteraceae bacterium]